MKRFLAVVFLLFSNPLFAEKIYLNSGLSIPGYNIKSAWADLNGDSYPDLIAASNDETDEAIVGLHLNIYLNDRGQELTHAWEITLTDQEYLQNGAVQVRVADFDKDGRSDIFLLGSTQSYVFLRSANSLNFTLSEQWPTNAYFGSTAIADFDRDGNTDIIYCSTNGTIHMRGLGGGKFAQHGALDRTFTSCIEADFDKNSVNDILYYGPTQQKIAYLGTVYNYGYNRYGTAGNFNSSYLGLPSLRFVRLAVGKFGYDGYPDIVVSGLLQNDFKTVTYLIQNNGNSQFTKSNFVFPTRLGLGSTVTLDTNRDGYSDILFSEPALDGYGNGGGTGELRVMIAQGFYGYGLFRQQQMMNFIKGPQIMDLTGAIRWNYLNEASAVDFDKDGVHEFFGSVTEGAILFKLTDGFPISGTVSFQGRGVYGVTVRATSDALEKTVETQTGLNGTYSFPPLPVGEYEITAQKPDHTITDPTRAFTISTSGTTMNFEIAALPRYLTEFSISGYVSYRSKGVSELTVTASPHSTGTSQPVSVRTDAGGKYELSGLPRGTYTVSVSGSGYALATSSKNVTLVDKNALASFVVNSIPASAQQFQISGRVTYNGQPVSGTRIKIGVDDKNPSYNVYTKADGTYVIPNLLPSNYSVALNDARYNTKEASQYLYLYQRNGVANFEVTSLTGSNSMDYESDDESDGASSPEAVSAPSVYTQNTKGVRGKVLKLKFQITGGTGEITQKIKILNRKKTIKTITKEAGHLSSMTRFITYKIPENAPDVLRYCVIPKDSRGLVGSERCSTIRVSGR